MNIQFFGVETNSYTDRMKYRKKYIVMLLITAIGNVENWKPFISSILAVGGFRGADSGVNTVFLRKMKLTKLL